VNLKQAEMQENSRSSRWRDYGASS